MSKRKLNIKKHKYDEIVKAKISKLADKSAKPNLDLANALQEWGDYERNINGQIYKYAAYHRASKSIAEFPVKINSGEEALILDGVGKKVAARIDDYLKHGQIKELEIAKKSNLFKSINELIRVMGIGPAVARKFYNRGIQTLDDLRANKDILTHEQQIGLKYLEDFEKPIPRERIVKIESFLKKEIETIDEKFLVELGGSFRRGQPFSNDIDVLLTHPLYVSKNYAKLKSATAINEENLIVQNKKSPKFLVEKVIDVLAKKKFITDTIAFGETKFMGVCRFNNQTSNHHRIDIRIFPHDEYYTALLYYTGSEEFNHQMRREALGKGFTLNEYSLRKIGSTGVAGKPLEIKSEHDIFKAMDMEYKKPEERNVT